MKDIKQAKQINTLEYLSIIQYNLQEIHDEILNLIKLKKNILISL